MARGSACETKALASLYLPDPSIGVRREQRTLDKGGSFRRAPLQPRKDDEVAMNRARSVPTRLHPASARRYASKNERTRDPSRPPR